MQALLKKCFGPAVDAAVPDVGSTPTTRAALTKSPSRLASELKAAKTAKLSRPRHVKLLGDVAAAVGAAVCVTPLCMMVDVAITQAAAVQVDARALEHARGRVREMHADAERQVRLESFGLGSLEPPNEFVCPITLHKMRGAPLPPSPLTSGGL